MSSRFITELERATGPAAQREQFLQLARSGTQAHRKSSGPLHFTASAIVIDASGEHIALHLHRKVGAWLQFGGHIDDGETSFEQAARREAAEESGLRDLQVVGDGPAMLHAHALNQNFAHCREHWDVQYLLRAPFTPASAEDGLAISERESAGLAWFGLDDLPAGLVQDLHATLAALGLDRPQKSDGGSDCA
ncbi:NUDIX hydrolase [Helcobacillus massiliensis]|uniref:NUDIX hydrolase n=1 Tax=Helcobacillus massiliensis TaxID=521392 RepID=UPI002552639C|nr:NUDIX domain-containing protein [Helcobacillus massiliensis]MDK7741804.1 NUDIX domain-containing protein [Helcobacillus massiliensis]WOO92101.1 NUDIX domain-containing protein [Helcobacillus massiliensis]